MNASNPPRGAPARTANVGALRQAAKAQAGTAVATTDAPPIRTIGELIARKSSALVRAMPRHVKPERLLQVFASACKSTPQLMQCSASSLLVSVMVAGQLGLEPNTPLGLAYLVPFWNNKQKRQDAQLVIGYRGYIELARRSGRISKVTAHLVRAGDAFDFQLGTDEWVRHKPASGTGAVTHAYACASVAGSDEVIPWVMYRDELDAIRDAQLEKAGNGRAYHSWSTSPDGMMLKSPIRRVAKFLPLSPELALAVLADEGAEDVGDQRALLAGMVDGIDDVADLDEDDDPKPRAEAKPDPEPERQEPAKAETQAQAEAAPARAAAPARSIGGLE